MGLRFRLPTGSQTPTWVSVDCVGVNRGQQHGFRV